MKSHPVYMLSFNQFGLASKTNTSGPFGFTDIPKHCEIVGDPVVIDEGILHDGKLYSLCQYEMKWFNGGTIDLDESGKWIFLCHTTKAK